MIQFKIIFLFFTILICGSLTYSQDNSTTPCAPETDQFDFWIGKWKVEWKNNDGTSGAGTNLVNSILGGCVIEENFDAKVALNFLGKSFSVYNSNKNLWQQTWVDNQGGYMVFTGGMQDDKMILSRKITVKDKEVFQRMVFHNITDDEFDWDWETSNDGGETWQLSWKIHYSRIQESN